MNEVINSKEKTCVDLKFEANNMLDKSLIKMRRVANAFIAVGNFNTSEILSEISNDFVSAFEQMENAYKQLYKELY